MTTPPTDTRHFLDGGPFTVCDCNFKTHVDFIGVICLRCGKKFDGLFVIRRGKQIRYQEVQP